MGVSLKEQGALMRERSSDFDHRLAAPAYTRTPPLAPLATNTATNSARPSDAAQTHANALRQALTNMGADPLAERVMHEPDAATHDGPTNIYLLAQYKYQLSISAVTMADHELGLLLPRSGRTWFNAKLFSDVPHGHELAQRDAWWRVVDTSPAVRFLLGWCISIFRVARFHQVPRDQLPGWSRILHFSPMVPDASRMRLQFWSDVVQDVTGVFCPQGRIWRQIQAFTPINEGDPRWQARLALVHLNVGDVLHFLADRGNCPSVLVRRALDGNPPIESYEDYRQFTEALIDDLPRLKLQRTIAMRHDEHEKQRPQQQEQTFASRLPSMLRSHWTHDIPDPRQDPSFWQLHL